MLLPLFQMTVEEEQKHHPQDIERKNCPNNNKKSKTNKAESTENKNSNSMVSYEIVSKLLPIQRTALKRLKKAVHKELTLAGMKRSNF